MCSEALTDHHQLFHVKIHQNEKYDSQFSLIGIDASIANAFRRILLAEVSTFAIEKVWIHNNTSIIQDEILAQRLGLIPLTGNPEGLRKMVWWRPIANQPDNPNANHFNTLVLKLQATCTRNKEAAKDETDPLKLYHNAHIYAKDLVFCPQSEQSEWFSEENGPIRAFNPDILIAKMRPGQEIDLEMHCRRGVGSDHAKFSPVATATYRLLPLIQITKPILDQEAKKFARCFPRGVIGMEEVTEDDALRDKSYAGHVGKQKAVVRNAFQDTVSRECLRHEEFQGKVKLGRVRDHFIFSVESTGQYESDDLFLESVRTMKAKVNALRRHLSTLV